MAQQASWRNLFFIRRRPKRNVPKIWTPPATQEELQALLQKHDFLTDADIQAYIESQKPAQTLTLTDFPVVRADMAFLHDPATFIGDFFKVDTAANYHQNQYFRYSWYFTFLAVATTFMSVTTLVMTTYGWGIPFAIITTFIGVLTAIFSNLNRTRQPQRNWYVNRRQAEALRNHYFMYIGHVRPYRGSDYLRKSQLYTAAARIGTIGKVPTSTAETSSVNESQAESSSLSPVEVEFLRWVYTQKRYQQQMVWYENRREEFEQNVGFTGLAAIVILAFASFIPLLTVISTSDNLGRSLSVLGQILAAILPSIAAAMIAFQQIYNWERQNVLYEETLANLRDLRGKILLDNPTIENERELADTIAAVEMVFARESDQWGQEVIQIPPVDKRAALLDQLDDTLEQMGGNLPDEVKQRIRSLANNQAESQPPPSRNPNEPPV
jgi:hypothetical protein